MKSLSSVLLIFSHLSAPILLFSVVAMGLPKVGTILAFKYNGTSSRWDQYGSMIEGLSPRDATGYSISLSDTGSSMLVGSPKAINLDGSRNAGKTTMYVIDGSEWQMMGKELYGEAENDLDGTSVAMAQNDSESSAIIVIGGKGRSGVNTTRQVIKSTGHCRVFLFKFQVNEWEFLHSLQGEHHEEQLGSSVAVSSDGNIITCGGVNGVRFDSERSGVVRLWNRVTQQESTIWPREVGNDADGASFGTSLAISADAGYVIVGAPNWSGADGEGSSGAMQVFNDQSLASGAGGQIGAEIET